MNITAFNGSPRGSESNTNVIVEAFLAGASDAGAEVRNIFLAQKDVKNCVGCFSCWFRTPGVCVHRDDMADLLRLYVESDVVCFATPVYTWNMTACLKNFVDRLIPLKCPSVVQNDGNFDMKNSLKKMPDIVVIANAGFPGENNFHTMREVMKSASPVLEIYRNCGMSLRMKSPAARERVEPYLSSVKEAGRQIASKSALSDEVRRGIDRELFTVEEYIGLITPKA